MNVALLKNSSQVFKNQFSVLNRHDELHGTPAAETLSEQSLTESLDGFTLIVDADGSMI